MFEEPVTYGLEKITERLLGGFVTDFLAAFPILIGVSIGVYALISMISSKLAKTGVAGVFLYGTLIVLI